MITPPPSSSPDKSYDALDTADSSPKEADRYPKTELEWLATSTYNRAVDYYIRENDEKAKMWAEKSFVVAQWIEDDGVLRDYLMEKFSTLQFDDK